MDEITGTGQAIAAAVRAEMARQDRKQHELAAVLDISQQAVSRRWRGEMPWRADEIVETARWLGIPVARLMLGDSRNEVAR